MKKRHEDHFEWGTITLVSKHRETMEIRLLRNQNTAETAVPHSSCRLLAISRVASDASKPRYAFAEVIAARDPVP